MHLCGDHNLLKFKIELISIISIHTNTRILNEMKLYSVSVYINEITPCAVFVIIYSHLPHAQELVEGKV